MVANLRARLERKSFEKGKLYFRMEKFRSAIIALNTTILEFPNTQYKEEVLYLILKSNYLFAINSVLSKKVERFEESIKSYESLIGLLKFSGIKSVT